MQLESELYLRDRTVLIWFLHWLDDDKEQERLRAFKSLIVVYAIHGSQEDLDEFVRLLDRALRHPRCPQFESIHWVGDDDERISDVYAPIATYLTRPGNAVSLLRIEFLRRLDSSRVLKALGEAIAHENCGPLNLTLSYFNLRNDMLDHLFRPAAIAMNRPIRLRRLRISHSYFDIDSASCLRRFLQSANCTLMKLGIEQCFLNDSIIEQIVPALPNHLEEVAFISCFASRDPALCERLRNLLERPGNCCKAIAITGGCLLDVDAEALAAGIAHPNSRLEELDLNDNMIALSGARAIFHAIRTTTGNRLRILRLKSTSIPPAGFRELFENLTYCNNRLQELDTWYITEPDEAELLLAKALESPHNKLRCLTSWISANKLVFNAWVEAFKSYNNKVQKLVITAIDTEWGEPLDAEDIMRLYKSVRLSNVRIFSLSLPQGESTIAEELSKGYVQVIYTLLSIKHIPRLSKEATWCRILPLSELVPAMSKALRWKLHLLSLSGD